MEGACWRLELAVVVEEDEFTEMGTLPLITENAGAGAALVPTG